MGIFNHQKRKQSKAWWEIAAEYPADELFYEPTLSGFDPQGSYTGNPTDGGQPEQDADDL